ncbi:hypothetical protein SDC9_96768 [bioreactor metagenome]|uniref:Uncharacterized protein n=1 Tax=bioreactor metagenome TaxID=1076179 RepID=A0A645AK40_9ZZZZ
MSVQVEVDIGRHRKLFVVIDVGQQRDRITIGRCNSIIKRRILCFANPANRGQYDFYPGRSISRVHYSLIDVIAACRNAVCSDKTGVVELYVG